MARWCTTAVQTGTYVDSKAGRATVGALAPMWLQVKAGRVRPQTLYGYQSLLKVLVLPRWGAVPVAGITTADVEAWISTLSVRGPSASRTRQAHLVLSGVLDTAVKARNLAVSPAHGIGLPRLSQSPRRYLTMGQLEALVEAAGE